jgi:DNA-binding transcriptional LysR family regulator
MPKKGQAMNLVHLRTFVTIVEQGSLSAAARTLRISQPAVTKQVQRMESELGLSLLVRGPQREVELTPAGQRMLVFAQETLARFDAFREEMATLQAVGRGTLSLAASTIPGEYLLPGLLAAFRVEYPQVAVQMSIGDTDEVASRLLADEADVGVIGSAVAQPGLRLERLVSDQVVLIVPPGHAFAGRDEITVEELRGQPLILREEGSGTRRSVAEALASAGASLAPADVVLTLGSTQAIIQAVEQGLGLGFVSARACAQSEAAGRLARGQLAGIDLQRNLYLAYQPQRAGDPLVARFLDFARSHLTG